MRTRALTYLTKLECKVTEPMKTTAKLRAFVCGVAAVAVARALLAVLVAQPGSETIEVCANVEGVMRLTRSAEACGPDERRLVLNGPELKKPCEEPPPNNVPALERRLAELEGLVDSRWLSSPVVAPFQVVNEADIPVFEVEAPNPGVPDLVGTNFYNDAGARVAVIAANNAGGSFSVSSGSVATLPSAPSVSAPVISATIRARGTDVGIDTHDSTSILPERRFALGRRANGRYGLSVFGPGGKLVAGIGESEVGSGIVLVADAAGNPRMRLFRHSETGGGELVVTDAAGTDVATLSGSGYGDSGLLRLANKSGTDMVQAGVTKTGVGAVIAGPAAFQHGLMFLGLPGSYIVGKQ